jgi:hypothetical protein
MCKENRKKVVKRTLSGAVVKVYSSIGEAARENKIGYTYLWENTNGGKLIFRDFVYEKLTI